MASPTLIINGVTLPHEARLDYQQTFERLDGGAEIRRRANGAAFSMNRWERWTTTISGGGWIPAPLLSIQRGVPFTVASVAPISLRVGEPLPAGWSTRLDWPEWQETDAQGGVWRLFFPVLTVVSARGARYVTGGVRPQWELACEES